MIKRSRILGALSIKYRLVKYPIASAAAEKKEAGHTKEGGEEEKLKRKKNYIDFQIKKKNFPASEVLNVFFADYLHIFHKSKELIIVIKIVRMVMGR